MEKLFIAKPYNMPLFHVFDSTLRSLCGKVGMLRADPKQMGEVNGSEMYSKGQDCKAYFKKANLKTD